MMKATKLAVILVSAGLTVGCASKSDFDALKARVDGLEVSLGNVKATAESAQSTAQDADMKAQQALVTANKTKADVESMLNAGFRKHMQK